jgi:hypothetical protein
VAALYNGARWVVWSIWVVFVVLHGIRLIVAIIGVVRLASEWIYHQGSWRLISSNAAHMAYSPLGGQCLPGFTSRVSTSPTTYLPALAPTILDLYLLVLTIVKAFKSAALSKSHPSSPIVCIVLDFGLSLKLIYIHQDARIVARRNSVCGSVSHYEADYYMLASQMFCHHSESAQVS